MNLASKLFKGDLVIWIIFMFLCLISAIEVFSASSTLAYKSATHWEPIADHATFLLGGCVLVLLLHNIHCRWYALQSMTTPLVLILGGTDKGNDYSEIEELVKKKVHALVFLGVDNAKLHGFFDGKVPVIEDARSMEEAVSKAYKLAEKGDTVLLSPCCASFDLFKSYEDRGDQFKACVRNL